MVWLVLSAVLISIIAVIAFTQVRIQIDSDRQVAGFSWGSLAFVRLSLKNEMPVASLNILGWRRHWNLVELIAHHKKHKDQNHTKRRIKKDRKQIRFRKILNMARSFKVEEFKLKLDTDDFVVNAWLWPAAEFLRFQGADVRINFEGVNEIKLSITNSPFRLLIAWIK